ncbi:acyl-CoA dehydrogenase family protein [Nocardioides zeae]|uniref:Acyl-CoA dehydrogenase family protein n=1 Tax=Nocardioides imazamoxiresistens TaxID=3231893 RepID=A0ABU3PSQ6_9ACTN|nr:acyl-CoA dehydrogenase family protein [Nocardioides zeae]MDT9592214.1 acyl-CoA dehydrogenase family protein [Nocardioides zeae]
MPEQLPPTVHAPSLDLVESIVQAVEGVAAAFPRSLFLQRAREQADAAELWQALVDAGLLSIGVPEEHGGAGGGLTGSTAVMEALARVGLPPLLYSLTSFSREAILRYGTPEQVAQHVVPTMTGERKICFGVTEPEAGTNSFAIRTSARPDGDGYRINGQKVFISGADQADHILLLTRTAPAGETLSRRSGFGLFMVDLATPGITLNRLDIEWYAPENQYEVFFDDVVVPRDALIGEDGLGFDYLLACLNQERITIAAWALGLGNYALEKAVEHATVRAPFGRPIGANQAVQHPLALAKAEMEAARTVMYGAAAGYDSGHDAGDQANVAKLLGSRAALAAVEASIQTHGGSAFVYESDVVTLWPMIRILQIAPINNESVLSYIAERVLGLPRS